MITNFKLHNQYGYPMVLKRSDHKYKPETHYEKLLAVLKVIKSKSCKRAEIARILNIHRATVGRLVDELSIHHPILEDDDRKLYLGKI